MGYKRKTALTQRNIKNALVNLLETNKFDFITINQIVEEAEITRSTFYRYYDDKYELISEIEEEILEHIHKERQKMDENYSEEDLLDVEMFKHLFDTLEPYSNTIHRLLGYNGDSGFEMKLKNEISRRFIDIEQHNHISQVRADLFNDWIGSSILVPIRLLHLFIRYLTVFLWINIFSAVFVISHWLSI